MIFLTVQNYNIDDVFLCGEINDSNLDRYARVSEGFLGKGDVMLWTGLDRLIEFMKMRVCDRSRKLMASGEHFVIIF